MGAVALPLFTLFGPDALHFRLSDSGAKVLITSSESVDKVMAMHSDLPDLEIVIATDASRTAGVHDFEDLLGSASDEFQPASRPIRTTLR